MASRTESFPRITVDFSLGPEDSVAPCYLKRTVWELLTPEQEIRYGAKASKFAIQLLELVMYYVVSTHFHGTRIAFRGSSKNLLTI